VLAHTHDFRASTLTSYGDDDLEAEDDDDAGYEVRNEKHVIDDSTSRLMEQTKQYRRMWTKALTPTEKELGIIVAVAEDFSAQLLFSTSFEEFLVRTYFEEWAFISSEDHPIGEPVPATLKEYLVRVYSEKGRNMLD
jgi:hypothetical protein